MTTNVRETFWKTLSASPYLMVRLNEGSEHALPMTAQLDPDADSALWFYTSRDSRIARGGPALASYVARKHDLFASIAGLLVTETDPAIIDRYWSNEVAAWYDGGRADPDLLMLRFDLGDAEVWTSDISIKGLFKLATGAHLRPEDSGQHAHLTL